MRIRNNTNNMLVLYFGDSNREEPEAVKKLRAGEDIDLNECPSENISIQER